ncbi:MAG TPA: MFS transporter [Thermoleophilaceae bacterium]|jgi:hypothetical protein
MHHRLTDHRGFRLLLAGQTLTTFGDLALVLVLGIWAKELTGSTPLAGCVFLALLTPMLLAPLIGLLVDRLPRRKLLIANDAATAVALLPLLLVDSRGEVWILFAVAAAYGLSQQVLFAARAALLETMLEDEQLGPANAAFEITRQALRVCAPAAGAALFSALGGPAVAVLDVLTFVASAILLSLLRAPDLERRQTDDQTLARQLGAGLRHIRSTPVLRRLIAAACVAVAVLGVLQVAAMALVDEGLGRPPAFLGVIFAFEGAGSIAGGLLAPAALRRLGEPRLAAAGLVAMSAGLGLMAIPSVTPVLAGAIVAGGGFAAFMVGYTTLLQRSTASELQGRVFSAAEATAGIPYCGTLALTIAGVSLVDYRLLLLASMVLLAGAGAYLARGPDSAPTRVRAAITVARRASAH